jgi:hypothetical protein
MKFVRSVLSPEECQSGAEELAGRLRCGLWLVEAGCAPPAAHRPGRLLAPMHALHGAAISMRTATLLRCDLAAPVVLWLRQAGCVLAEHSDVALHEILVNAAIHGNLRVPAVSALGWQALDERVALIAAALEAPHPASRMVTIAAGWNANHAMAAVIDEGAGYSVADLPHPAPGTAPRATGRGLLITQAVARLDLCDGGRCARVIFARAPGCEA